MYDCELWDKGTEKAVLYYVEEEHLNSITEISRCFEALKELGSFVKPLSVELEFMCSHREHAYFDYKLKLSQPVGHLEVTPLPPEVYIDRNDLAKVKTVPAITIEAISNLAEELLQQQCSNPDFEPSWSVMNIEAVRAKVTDESKLFARDTFLVESRTGRLEFPLVRHDDGLWVYGPKNVYRSYPPIGIRFTSEGGAHKMNIYVAWSMWYDANSFGYKKLYEAINRIISKGWELSDKTPLEKPKYAA